MTIMEDAPSFTHLVSSHEREGVACPVNRSWTIVEALRATMASPIYISPLCIETDEAHRFQDAGFGGFNNPLELASKEAQMLWPDERIKTVVSLGSGLGDFLPPTRPEGRQWGPTPQYVGEFVDEVIRKRLPDVYAHDIVRLNVAYAIRQLARIAADSSNVHQEFGTNYDPIW